MKEVNKLTFGNKVSMQINKEIKKAFAEYAQTLGYRVDMSVVKVYGNSQAYASTVVMPAFDSGKYEYYIFTQVDEKSNFIGLYILTRNQLAGLKAQWICTKYDEAEGVMRKLPIYLLRYKYEQMAKYQHNTLMQMANKIVEAKRKAA